MSDQNIILDAHEFRVDTTLLAQYGGGSKFCQVVVSSIGMSQIKAL